jgi:putative peptide zinc metalloprotease protein
VPDLPALMPGIQLMGMMPDTGFAEQQWLVQRGPTFVQLSELLYRVLEQVDGRRTLEEIAALARETTGRPVSANNVRLLIAARLLPLGLVVPVGGVAQGAQAATARSPLAVTLKLGFMPPGWVEVVARVLQVFFWPPLLIPILLLVAVSQAWLYFVHGAFAPFAATLQQPLLLTGIEIFIFVSAVFHEFGHASALRYGGGRARGIGFGLYFIFTAFYTDCTDSYRLGRWARLRTDLGGVYFDLITTLGLTLAYLATRQEVLLAAVILLDLEILEQIDPIGRYDGYWALADLIGVPDFLTLMKPTLLGLVPAWLRGSQPSAPSVAVGARTPALKGWVKTAFLIYTAVFVPLLPIFIGLLLIKMPGLFQFFIESLAAQLLALIAAAHAGARLDLIVSGASAAILVVTLAMMAFGFVNILRSLIGVIWRWGAKTRTRRALALVGIVGGLALLALAWAPQIQQLAPHIADLVTQIRQSW